MGHYVYFPVRARRCRACPAIARLRIDPRRILAKRAGKCWPDTRQRPTECPQARMATLLWQRAGRFIEISAVLVITADGVRPSDVSGVTVVKIDGDFMSVYFVSPGWIADGARDSRATDGASAGPYRPWAIEYSQPSPSSDATQASSCRAACGSTGQQSCGLRSTGQYRASDRRSARRLVSRHVCIRLPRDPSAVRPSASRVRT